MAKQRGLCVLMLLSISWALQVSGDSWQTVVQNSGVSAMHMMVTHTNRVIIFDRTDYGPSQIKLAGGKCRNDNKDMALKTDCWAHSVEVDLATNGIRPLEVLSDTWCSSGAFVADGSLLQTGGWNDGANVMRTLGTGAYDDWVEHPGALSAARWYSSNLILPDGQVIVVGGRRQFNYEFVPTGGGLHNLPFLQQTSDASENNLYPFLHLSSDGNIFVFANKDSILLNYRTGAVVKTFPALAGGPRNYPSSGSSVILPLYAADNFQTVEVMICGGSSDGAFTDGHNGNFLGALQTCGRMVITSANPQWTIEEMPSARVMGDMVLLPTGEVLIINGAQEGTAGWGLSRSPNLGPVLYNPGSGRFTTMTSSGIPRLYHSTAILLPEGRILVGGSNPNVGYAFSGVLYPTELRLEKYSPYYLAAGYNFERPDITYISNLVVAHGTTFTVTFSLNSAPKNVAFNLYAPPFTTHTFSMNQRLLFLAAGATTAVGARYVATVTAPPTTTVAPSGYYMFAVVNNGIPSPAAWIKLA